MSPPSLIGAIDAILAEEFVFVESLRQAIARENNPSGAHLLVYRHTLTDQGLVIEATLRRRASTFSACRSGTSSTSLAQPLAEVSGSSGVGVG